ncbi:MAG: glycosyl transferase family 2 [Chloroflexota bacterium]
MATIKFILALLCELFWPPRTYINLVKVWRVVRAAGIWGVLHEIVLYFRWIKRKVNSYQDDPEIRYAIWLKKNEPDLLTFHGRLLVGLWGVRARMLGYRPKFSIIMPTYNTRPEHLVAAIESVRAQCYPYWELCVADDGSADPAVRQILKDYAGRDSRIKIKFLDGRRGIVGASNAALELATGEFVTFLDHDDELAPWALYEVARRLNADQTLDVIYSDEDKIDLDGRRTDPFFKPGFSPETLLGMNYMAHLLVVRRNLVEEVGGFRMGFDGSQDHDLVLRLTERTSRVGHIPKVLYHWRKAPGSAAVDISAKPYAVKAAIRAIEDALQRRGLSGTVETFSPSFYRIRWRLKDTPLISIIIPVRDQVNLLKRCVESIFEKSTYRKWELLIVNNQSSESATLAFLNELSKLPNVKILEYNDRFNFSKINNFAVNYAEGEVLLFLNNDVEVVTPNWLEELLGFAERPWIGAVGAKLLLPDGRIQHGGVVLGLSGGADHAFYGLPGDEPGYFGLAAVARNCSAVTAACLMTRRRVFEEVGGFDPNLDVAFNDVDLCLKMLAAGYRVVWTPFAVLYHYESSTRRKAHPVQNTTYFLKKWGDLIRRGDPYYNPNLALDRFDFSIKL